MSDSSFDPFVQALLKRLLARHSARQLFLFGAEGDPFFAARPLEGGDMALLRQALDLLQELEQHRPRPFMAADPSCRFTVAALDEQHDLYIVVLNGGPVSKAAVAEQMTRVLRDEMSVYVPKLREGIAARKA